MATDFFQRQQRARSQAFWLRVLFAIALCFAALVDAVGIVLFANIATLGAAYADDGRGAIPSAFFHSMEGWTITLVLLLVMGAFSAATAWQHRGGGGALARALRGTRVTPDTTDPDLRQLLNIVAEMSLAARMPEPEIWVLEREEGINAFAAGRSIEGAAIGVTRGALRELDRDELQAVIAHEFSHILNGDMALNTRLVAWLSGLFAIEGFARSLKRDKEDESGGRTKIFWIDIGVWLFHMAGMLGLFIGRALQAAICRRREALADASAVQFTRNPGALKSALLKIEAVAGAGRLGGGAAAGMAHMFFAPGDVLWRGLLQHVQGVAFSTHPPMIERVRALDGRMTEAQYRGAVRERRREHLQARARAAAPVELGGERLKPVAAARIVSDAVPDLSCSRLNLEQQKQVLDLHARLSESKDNPPALVIAALLDRRPQQGRAQLIRLAPLLGAALTSRVPTLMKQLGGLPDVARLPLIAGMLPQLRAQPDRRRLVFVKVLRAFEPQVAAEDTLRFVTLRLALRELVHAGTQAQAAPRGEPAPVDGDASEVAHFGVLLSLLASGSAELAGKAFRAGLDGLIAPLRRPDFTPAPIPPAAVDEALAQLALLSRPQRLAFGAACVRTIAANRSLAAYEAELLRLYCTSLAIPIPAPGVRADTGADSRHGISLAAHR